jgi:AcrR family transcriptional regulator
MSAKLTARQRISNRLKEAKQQDRAISTRRDLMEAARRIFARDGFEMARLEDIATAAGKTRGAFYANFRDKEDVFFALFEENLRREKRQMGEQLSEVESEDERIEVLARHLLSVLQNRRRMLLALEFKLYAVRHPKKQKRLADLHATMCARCMEADLEKLLPEFANATPAGKRVQSAQIGVILDGLALNSMFDDGSLSDEQALRLLRANLRVVLGLE